VDRDAFALRSLAYGVWDAVVDQMCRRHPAVLGVFGPTGESCERAVYGDSDDGARGAAACNTAKSQRVDIGDAAEYE
jgi:hypothetical protein